jgi:hypothetical protein
MVGTMAELMGNLMAVSKAFHSVALLAAKKVDSMEHLSVLFAVWMKELSLARSKAAVKAVMTGFLKDSKMVEK